MRSGSHQRGSDEATLLPVTRWNGASSFVPWVVKKMAQGNVSKREPKQRPGQDHKKTPKNGGYTIPVQMS